MAPLAARRAGIVSRRRGRAARLVWERPDGAQRRVPARGQRRMLVGRDEDADIRVDEPLVSRAHARIERRGRRLLRARPRLDEPHRVNGEVVRERELRHGDELRFARARCRFVSPPADPVAAGV